LHVEDVIRNAIPNAELYVPKLPLETFSLADPTEIARTIVATIDERVSEREKGEHQYKDITLVGHSIGGLLVRKVYVLANGETSDARFNYSGSGPLESAKPWAERIHRIVLLAGMNRGWSISHHMGLIRAVMMTIGVWIGNILLMVTGRPPTAFQIRRGAPFITQLRLQWIAMERRRAAENESLPEDERKPLATVVQLLGSIDDIVSPEDNIDLVTGSGFVYLDVPKSGHQNVIEMDSTHEGKARREVFTRALTEPEDKLRPKCVIPADQQPRAADAKVSDVVFVIHGIRDTGYWTQKIARCVQRAGNLPPKIYSSETSTYGYFAMFPFLLFARRREKVAWLMDQYVEARALYPNARFSYVGHSNGTYLLARALKDYRACRFENVIFAGSVVPRRYDWYTAIGRGQVKALLNYVATTDLVVAWFPGAIEKLRLQDLGSAGHNGFDQITARGGAHKDKLFQCSYVSGGHGAALREDNWEAIAHFIVHGVPKMVSQGADKPYADVLAPHRSWWVVFFGWIAPLIWVAIALLLAWAAWFIWKLPLSEWLRTLGEVAYFWVLIKIGTKI